MNYQYELVKVEKAIDILKEIPKAIDILKEIPDGISRFHNYIDDGKKALEYAKKDLEELIKIMPEEKNENL